MREYVKQHHLVATAVSDPSLRFQKKYNAQWQPRSFLFASTGRLLWKQNGMRVDASALDQAILQATKDNAR